MLALASAGRWQRHVNSKVLELEQGIGGGAVAGRWRGGGGAAHLRGVVGSTMAQCRVGGLLIVGGA